MIHQCELESSVLPTCFITPNVPKPKPINVKMASPLRVVKIVQDCLNRVSPEFLLQSSHVAEYTTEYTVQHCAATFFSTWDLYALLVQLLCFQLISFTSH